MGLFKIPGRHAFVTHTVSRLKVIWTRGYNLSEQLTFHSVIHRFFTIPSLKYCWNVKVTGGINQGAVRRDPLQVRWHQTRGRLESHLGLSGGPQPWRHHWNIQWSWQQNIILFFYVLLFVPSRPANTRLQLHLYGALQSRFIIKSCWVRMLAALTSGCSCVLRT